MRRATIGETCTVVKGTTGINKAIPGRYPLVVTGAERKSHNEYQFDDDAVIIPLVSSTGHGHKSLKRIHFQTGKFAVGSILCAVIPKDKTQLSAEYLYRYLDLNRERELVSRMKGMANVTLPLKEIEQIELPLPKLDQQLKFVASYQNLEAKSFELSFELTHQLAGIKKLRQAILREAMQGKLVPQDSNDEPASQLLKRIKTEKSQLVKDGKIKKEKELPPIKPEDIPFEIPETWVWCKLGELFEIVRGSSPRPKGDPRFFAKQATEFHWITIADFAKHSTDDALKNTSQFLTREGTSYSRKVTPADLLVASSGVGSVGKSSKLGITGFIYDGLMAIKNIQTEATKEYILSFLKVKELEIYSIATGANWLNINTDVLNNYLLPLPPLSEQQRITAKLEQLLKYCYKMEQSVKLSQIQNKQLLQQALSEALRPNESVQPVSEES